MKKVAVVLSGCGFKDGAEITEAVSTLIALSELKVDYMSFAPNVDFKSTNHLKNTEQETRNAMIEASRITRGKIHDLKELAAKDFDAVVFPGGFGVAQLLCDWGAKGADCTISTDAKRVIDEFYNESKPIGAWCIAPALIARALGDKGVTVTIGDDKGTASEIQKTGAHHVSCAVDDYVTDREHKVITTPAYMYEAAPFEVFTGIRKALLELVEMA